QWQMRHGIEEQTRRHTVRRTHFQNIGRTFRRLRSADPRDRAVRRDQPHERETRQLRLPRAPLQFSGALIRLRSIGLSGAGVLPLLGPRRAPPPAQPAPPPPAAIASASTAWEAASAAEAASLG